MTLTNEQKQWLAKMLPDVVRMCECQPNCDTLAWVKESRAVLTTEYLHLISLVEAKLDTDIHSPESPRYAYSRALYNIVPADQQPFRATAPQRVTALQEVSK